MEVSAKDAVWKDGGPVIGIQLDNEFGGSPNYLLALKKMAIDAGIDVPFYNKTGWPAMETPPPLGEFLPLFGAYYMYHGGQNPEGKLSTLNESTASGYGNDLPVKSYDFNAPIGEFGQINPQYYWLRRLHLFLHDFGGKLAPMPAFIPTDRVRDKTDTETLRWSVRTDGNSGYVFVNNYQRLQPMGAKTDAQFKLNLPGGELVIPQKPGTVPAESFFFWPFNMDLNGGTLTYATAQPVCRQGDSFFFAEIPGVPVGFVFDAKSLNSSPAEFHEVKPDRNRPINLVSASGKPIQIILLSDADSLALQKSGDKIFFETPVKGAKKPVETAHIRDAGPAREIPLISGSNIVAAPTDEDFANAAVWQIKLPAKIDPAKNPLLQIHYIGDVARLTLNGKLIADNFYAGRPFDLGLKRYKQEILTGDLRLEILPLRKDAQIYIEPKNRPDFGTNTTLLKLESVEIVQ